MSKKEDALRVSVVQGNKGSSAWRIWDNKNDLYIATRDIAGLFKASLHESGFLNFSFTKQYYDKQNQLPLLELDKRHLGSRKLSILEDNVQVVFKIEIPLNEMLSEFNGEIDSNVSIIEIPSNMDGLITIRIINVPTQAKDSLTIFKSNPGYLKSFCNDRYVAIWFYSNEKKYGKYISIPEFSFCDENFPADLMRETLFGYDDDNTSGGYIDRKHIE